MRVIVCLLVLTLAHVTHAPAHAQELTGRYVYQSPQGPVGLVLQHDRATVTGVLTGVDGQVSRLEGRFDGQRAIGTIVMGGRNGWFAAGFLDGGLTLLLAEIGADGEPDLDNGWRLDFTRAGDVASAPAASRAAPSAPEPAASTPLVQEWLRHLRGKKVTYTESYSSSDMAGGYSLRWEAFLCSDMTFHYRSNSVGLGGGGESFSGTWRIVEHGGQPILQYQRQELAGTDQGVAVVLGHQGGQTFFDGARVYVTDDNTVCR